MIDKNNLPAGFLRAMHRPPALKHPSQDKVFSRLPSEELAREAIPAPARGLETVLTHDSTHSSLPDPKPQRDQAEPLGKATKGKEQSIPRIRVRFTGYRVRPLDPDNFAGSCKDLLDGLRHAGLIPGDEPWRIILETDQVRVGAFKEEKTVIEIG